MESLEAKLEKINNQLFLLREERKLLKTKIKLLQIKQGSTPKKDDDNVLEDYQYDEKSSKVKCNYITVEGKCYVEL